MSISRITNGFMVNQSVNLLNTNLNLLSNMQQQLSSGRNINQPSDDPVGLTQILSLANTLTTDERYARNVQDALSEVNVMDSVMTNMTELLHRSKELATQGANFTNGQNGLDAIAVEIDQIINQMVQLGNTSIGEKYLLGGKETGIAPFERIGDDVNYGGNAPATNWQREVEVSRGVTVTVNINGENLLGQAQVTAAGSPPVFAAGSAGVFETLIELRQNLLNGDYDETRNRLDEIDTDLNNILQYQGQVGAITNRLELTQARIQERQAIFTQQYADIQEIDMPSLVSDISFQESVFQNSLAVTGRVLQTSLLNFLQ